MTWPIWIFLIYVSCQTGPCMAYWSNISPIGWQYHLCQLQTWDVACYCLLLQGCMYSIQNMWNTNIIDLLVPVIWSQFSSLLTNPSGCNNGNRELTLSGVGAELPFILGWWKKCFWFEKVQTPKWIYFVNCSKPITKCCRANSSSVWS